MHQNRIWLTLKISLSGTFILLFIITTVSGLGSVVSRQYQYIEMHNTWQAAQNYCRNTNYADLANIYLKYEADRLYLKNYNAWIGLSRSNDIWTWQFGGLLDPGWWTLYKPQSYQNCAFARYNNDSVYGAHCGTHLFFICGYPYQYKVITQSKTWSEAQNYCRDIYSQLASFWDRDTMKSTANNMDFPVWIGLNRDGQKWTWTGGLSNYTNWAVGEPRNNGNCASISSLTKQMATQDCSTLLPSICYRDNLVLIKENKSWNEALEHCRALSSPTNQEFDLVSIQPQDYDYVKNKLVEANTEEVWTGLRFLAGEWLWVNGADMKYSDLPLCPPIVQRCGALSKSGTGSMEIRDCTERKNFMCYRKV